MPTLHAKGAARLPGGRFFDPKQPRSAGILDAEQLAYCRAHEIPLAYDPLQVGWVVAGCRDDFADDATRARADAERERARFRRSCRAVADTTLLRRWRDSDVPRFRALLDDPQVWRHLPEPYPDPLDEPTARALIVLSRDRHRAVVRAVVRDNRVVGQVRLELEGRYAKRADGAAEISYWLGREYWGQGIMTGVVALFSLRGFERYRLRSIFARVRAANTASIRLLEKSRYHREGSLADDSGSETGMRTYRVLRAEYFGDRPAATRRPYTGAAATR